MNFLLNIETFPVIKYQEQLFVYNTLVENWDHVIFLGLSISSNIWGYLGHFGSKLTNF